VVGGSLFFFRCVAQNPARFCSILSPPRRGSSLPPPLLHPGLFPAHPVSSPYHDLVPSGGPYLPSPLSLSVFSSSNLPSPRLDGNFVPWSYGPRLCFFFYSHARRAPFPDGALNFFSPLSNLAPPPPEGGTPPSPDPVLRCRFPQHATLFDDFF